MVYVFCRNSPTRQRTVTSTTLQDTVGEPPLLLKRSPDSQEAVNDRMLKMAKMRRPMFDPCDLGRTMTAWYSCAVATFILRYS